MECQGNVPKRTSFAVEYPGYVKNVQRMVETLGGVTAIADARTNNAPLLELRFRPEDPLSHPVFGDVHPTTSNLLLKITRKRKQPVSSDQRASTVEDAGHRQAEEGTPAGNASTAPERAGEVDAEDEEDECTVQAEVVARVESAYRFNGLADFQYTPVGSLKQRARLKEQKERRWRSEDESVPGFGTMTEDNEEPCLILPPLFCKNDLPQQYGFRTYQTKVPKPREAQDDGKGRLGAEAFFHH